MKIVKLAMMGLGVVGAILSLVYKLPSYGTHGTMVLVACLVPVALGALGTFVVDGMPRWASVLSALAFLIAAMKTTGGREFQNIMLIAVVGLLAAVALLIRPDRSRTRASAAAIAR
jgi:hypothetical protein